MKKALWKIFEESSLKERMKIVDTIKSSSLKHNLLPIYPKQIIHNIKWFNLRNSWYRSKEWREFRKKYLIKHPLCIKCGKIKNIMNVHHTSFYELDSSVLYEGFLKAIGIKEYYKYETECNDCHYITHKELIIKENETK